MYNKEQQTKENVLKSFEQKKRLLAMSRRNIHYINLRAV